MSKDSMRLPDGFGRLKGERIHDSTDPVTGEYYSPHVTGQFNGKTAHLPYVGQTTLSMYDKGIGNSNISDVADLHEAYPSTFSNSGWGVPKTR